MTIKEQILKYLYDNETDTVIDITDLVKENQAKDDIHTVAALLELDQDKHAYINATGKGDCARYFGKITAQGKEHYFLLSRNRPTPIPIKNEPSIKSAVGMILTIVKSEKFKELIMGITLIIIGIILGKLIG